MREVLEKILGIIRSGYNFTAMQDMYYLCKECFKKDSDDYDVALGMEYSTELIKLIEKYLIGSKDDKEILELYELHKSTLLIRAYDDFDSYLQYVEFNREPEKKFYMPRRKQLKVVVDALQELADGKIEVLCVSLPPGVGKTTLAIFYMTWLAGRNPDEPMLTGSHSNSFVRGVYDECLRIFDKNGEYLWRDVFPTVQLVNTNAKDCRIDLGKRKRFETLQFTSIGTGNAGLYRAVQLLYCDDLVSGLEVAVSIDRLNKLWETYATDLRQRKLGDRCAELHISTRWSVHDVIGRLELKYSNDNRAKFIVIPALDENEESNFDYPYGVGFSTAMYKDQRDTMDDVSWRALYMNQPIEREGLLYHPDELRRFFELPTNADGAVKDPDAILSVCDTKDKGTDFAVLPVAYKYGNDYYIVDCLCDDSLPEVVDERMVQILLKWKVHQCRFESNSAGGRVAEKVQKELKERGGRTNITTKYTTAHKETKIIVNSDFVKAHFLFKDPSTFSSRSEYGRMMNFLCSYTHMGKNKHDDVPDAMAMLSEYIEDMVGKVATVFQRPF